MRSNFTRYLHKSRLVVFRPKLSGNLKTDQEVRLSNIECKAWLTEILTNTYFAFLFCDRAPSAQIRVGQGLGVYGIQGSYKSGIRYIYAEIWVLSIDFFWNKLSEN